MRGSGGDGGGGGVGGGCGGYRAAGATTVAVGEAAATQVVGSLPVPPPAAQPPSGTEETEAVPAALEAAPELTAEAEAAVAQAAAAIEVQKSSRRGMFFEETDEEFEERMDSPGWRMEAEYREFYNIIRRKTVGPAETRAEMTERWLGGIWKEGKDALERRAVWLCRGGMAESRRSSPDRDGSEG